MKTVIVGSKYDGEDYQRFKLHEEYGRVWLYTADAEGKSLERILCVDDDGLLRIAADYYITQDGRIYLRQPIRRRPTISSTDTIIGLPEHEYRLRD